MTIHANGEQARYPEVLGGSAVLKDKVLAGEIDAVIIAITHLKSPELLKCALDCKMEGVKIYDMPSFYEEVTGRIPVEHVNDFWLLSTPIWGVERSVYNRRIKRMVDLVLSFSGIILSFPVVVALAVAIRIDSSGPVLFRQKRIGLNGRPFDVIKFRTMRAGTEGDGRPGGNGRDTRITKVGRIARFFRMDEIPQMWNVLMGDMSFIGPRALIEEEVRDFETRVPYFFLRHSIRPGITGWAQVNYPHGATVEDALEKLKFDLFYIRNLSPFLDLFILIKTIKVVLFGKGAK